MMVTALCGAGMVMIGYLQFSMSLSANYALLQKKYSRPMRKHREAIVRANKSTNGDMTQLIPPSQGPRIAPSIGGVHAPSQIPSQNYHDPGYHEQGFVSFHIIWLRLDIFWLFFIYSGVRVTHQAGIFGKIFLFFLAKFGLTNQARKFLAWWVTRIPLCKYTARNRTGAFLDGREKWTWRAIWAII